MRFKLKFRQKTDVAQLGVTPLNMRGKVDKYCILILL